MVEAQVQTGVEQATGTRLRDAVGHLLKRAGQHNAPDPMKDIIAEQSIVFSFRDLQEKRIGDLQVKLIGRSSQAMSGQPLPPGFDDLVNEDLKAYAQALRDYETLSVNALTTVPIGARLVGFGEETRGTDRRPFLEGVTKLLVKMLPGLEFYDGVLRAVFPFYARLFLSSDLAQKALQLVEAQQGPDSFASSPTAQLEAVERYCGKLGIRVLDQEVRLQRAKIKALIKRILMGLWGGVALIVPVIIMVVYPSRNTNLITVSVATIWFALAFAIRASDCTGKDVFAATAAYTAVLVVFFGTSGSTN